MAFPKQFYPNTETPRRTTNPLFAIAFLWGLAAVIVLTLLYTEFGLSQSVGNLYLVPWILGTAAVILAPSIYLIYKGNFDPFHPLVFPAWSYFFPGFVIGGLVLASGLSQPYFLFFIQDAHYNLPLTFVYVMLGFGGLTVGYVLPIGRIVGDYIKRWLPVWQWRTDQILLPGLILFGLGIANTILAFALGLIGFQKVEEIGAFDGLIFLVSLFWMQASFLLWLFIFKSEKLTALHYAVIALLIAVSAGKTAFQGNRGGILQVLILIGFAFVLSKKKITLKHNLVGAVLVVLALIAGMIYGTAFRASKGYSQEATGLSDIAENVTTTGEKLTNLDLASNLSNGFAALADRIDSVSSLGVIVSNYEALAADEEKYGISGNIKTELTPFFIPRAVWPDKPISIEPSKYADLYFNYPNNSFTMTPMGDLLRNFGPVGVPIGMIILGILLRILYSSLIENQPFSFWRSTMYFMLFTSISYEGTYGLIIPYLLKVLVVAFLGILLMRFVIGRGGAGQRIINP